MSPEELLVVLSEPRSTVSESYRALRASIQRVLTSGVHSLMFVSVYSGDGKSSVCANIAASLSQLFLDVVLVDGDLRRPTLTKLFDCDTKPGLSDYLASRAQMEDLFHPTGIERLRIVPAGTAPENPGDLVARPGLATFCKEIRTRCDVALFDTSPLSACSDALSIGAHIDTTALIISPRQWHGEVEVKIRQTLEAHNVPMMGVILNGVDGVDGGRYGSGGYGYGYGYGYGSRSNVRYGYGVEPHDGEQKAGRRGGFWSKLSSWWGQ